LVKTLARLNVVALVNQCAQIVGADWIDETVVDRLNQSEWNTGFDFAQIMHELFFVKWRHQLHHFLNGEKLWLGVSAVVGGDHWHKINKGSSF
jgi:hypothetical protein